MKFLVRHRLTHQNKSQKNEGHSKSSYKQAKANQKIEIEVTYFVPDLRKEGGKYVSERGIFEGVNNYKKCLLLQGEEEGIPLRYISEIKVMGYDD